MQLFEIHCHGRNRRQTVHQFAQNVDLDGNMTEKQLSGCGEGLFCFNADGP